MKRIIPAMLIITGVYFIGCETSTEEVSEGASSETVIGVVHYPDGEPVVKAVVKLRSSRFTPNPDSGINGIDTYSDYTHTDNDGAFGFDSVFPGDYTIEVNDGKEFGSLIKFVLDAEQIRQGTNMVLPSSTARKTGRITGTLEPVYSPFDSSARDSSLLLAYVYVVGVEALVGVDSTGSFEIPDLPEGTYQIKAESKYPYQQRVELSGIPVVSGQPSHVGQLNMNRIPQFGLTSTVPDGLIAYWNFNDGNGNVVEDLVGFNDGVAKNGYTWVEGKYGGAGHFDGVDARVDIPYMYLSGDFSITAWVYLEGDISNMDAIVGEELPRVRPGTNINFAQGYLRFHGNDYQGITDPIIADNLFPGEEWVHVALTRTDNLVTLYQQGQSVGTADWDWIFILNYIGRGEVNSLEGMLDEIRIYDRGLSAAEVMTLVNDPPK